ncbi:MAG TPA: OmpA family protein [Candidatus Acidoferrum sp.]|nr:OmpA family protein [Candidatus Acidoferrum sp.]
MAAILSLAAFAQAPKSGKVKIHVSPTEAYVFVDGEAKGPGSQSIELAPGIHTVLIANYGYTFYREQVSIESDSTVSVNADLVPFGGAVIGPRGRIQIESGSLPADKSAVFLNGKTPEYFVGHVDEFNQNIIWHQELVVPPGLHEVTVTRNGKEVWTGKVNVGENERVIIDMSKDRVRVKPWDRGTELGALARFHAGIASTTVAVAPVTGTISASPINIDCGQSSQLMWNSAEAVDAQISEFSPVNLNGDRIVSPLRTTTYTFTATGPGGNATSSVTVNVNPVVRSSMDVSPVEVRYRRIGNKVIEQNAVTLNWSSSNADTLTLSPFGAVGISGNKSIAIVPTQTNDGRVDETFTYTLHASNVCGGSEVKTASIHLTGSIEPIPDVLLHSVFFPTDYPSRIQPSVGLLRSQREELTALAKTFTKYLEYDPEAKLSLAAYADERESREYNQALSERRGQSVKDFLVAEGIPAEKITFVAHGEDNPLDEATVQNLQTQNPVQMVTQKTSNFRVTWLAYNRRVDILLLPTNQESVRFFPNGAPDSELLWQLKKADPKVIVQDQ